MRGALVQLDDDEDDVLLAKEEIKGRPDGNKSAKDKIRKQAEAQGLKDEIDEMMKSKEKLVNKTLETKLMMMEMRSQENKAKWEILREDEKLKAVVERRASADEKRAIAELFAEENKVMMKDPSNMDVYTRMVGACEDGDLAKEEGSGNGK
jgi:hypothetical protein